MIWISSDFHFNHKNIAGPKISTWKKGYRNFDSIEQMNDTIISAINACAAANDEMYFLGDFAFGDKTQIPELRSRINCKKIYLIYGNHDQAIRRTREYQQCFEWCRDYYELHAYKTIFCLSHYAPRVWNESHHGSYALWGHSHGTLPDDGHRSMDCGIDCSVDYMPFNLDGIVKSLEKRPATRIDHHTASTT